MNRRAVRGFHGALAVTLVVLALVGCQEIFTYTPLSGLRRDPASLTPAQRLQAARDALQSGDAAAMKAAYDAIKGDKSNDASYTAAQLGIELSGIGGLITNVLNGTVSLATTPGNNSIGNYVTATAGVDPSYLKDAGTRLSTLSNASYPLTTNDRLMGAVGLALNAAGPTYNLTTASTAALAPAVQILAPAKDTNPYVGMLYNYLAALP